jgi:tetratricopeptide (TPR) repeat protein
MSPQRPLSPQPPLTKSSPAQQSQEYLRTGDRLLRQGELAAALTNYYYAKTASPDSLITRWCLGVTLSAQRRPSLAVKEYREATRIAEDDLITALLLQGALQENEELGAAQQVYLDTVRRFSSTGKSGLNASGSIGRLQSALQKFPESPILTLLLGDAFQVSLRFDDAGRAYRKAIALAPSWPKPQINLGLSYLAQGKATLAVEVLGDALKFEPANPRALLALGDAQLQAGNNSGALKVYNQLTHISSVAIPAATGAARASMALGQASVAVASLQNARQRAPKDPAPAAALADIQMKTGNFADAADSYASALKLSEEGGLFSARSSLQRALAEAQLAAKRPADAQKTLELALISDPENAALWRRLLAKSWIAQNDLPAGEMELKRALVNELALYPKDTLEAIAAQGWTEKFIASFRADLQGARTGIRSSGSTQSGIVMSSMPISREGEITALAGLAHLLRFTSMVREEVSLRRELVRLRDSGADYFLLAQAQERLGEYTDARVSYGQARGKGDLPSSIQRLAGERQSKLGDLKRGQEAPE